VAGRNGTVIVFICSHCPYVKAVIDRMVADTRTLLGEGIGFAAICSNDAKLQRFAKAHGSRDRSMRRASTQCSRARSSIS
jgi:hypothetical protein